MDRDLEREIKNMRLESGRHTRDYHDHENSLNPAIFLLFRCFLAFAFFISGIIFPQINETLIPRELKDIPAHVSASYTIDDVVDFMDGMAN